MEDSWPNRIYARANDGEVTGQLFDHSFCLINDDADIAYEDNFKSANIAILKLPLKLLRELVDLNNVYWSIQSASPGSFKVLYMDSYAVSSFLSGVGSSLHDSNLSISPFRYSHDMLWNIVVHARQSKASNLNFSLDNQLAALHPKTWLAASYGSEQRQRHIWWPYMFSIGRKFASKGMQHRLMIVLGLARVNDCSLTLLG